MIDIFKNIIFILNLFKMSSILTVSPDTKVYHLQDDNLKPDDLLYDISEVLGLDPAVDISTKSDGI